jgi:hypothetical protein
LEFDICPVVLDLSAFYKTGQGGENTGNSGAAIIKPIQINEKEET